MLIVIRPSDGDVKPGGPLGAFREEQAMSRHQISLSPFLESSSHTTQLHYTYSHPNLNFLQYTIQILVPQVMWSAQAVCESKIDHTLLILQPFRHFTYITAHSATLPSLYLWQSSFSNPFIASPTSQLILQPFFRFSYVTGSSLLSPCEPPLTRLGRTNETSGSG